MKTRCKSHKKISLLLYFWILYYFIFFTISNDIVFHQYLVFLLLPRHLLSFIVGPSIFAIRQKKISLMFLKVCLRFFCERKIQRKCVLCDFLKIRHSLQENFLGCLKYIRTSLELLSKKTRRSTDLTISVI